MTTRTGTTRAGNARHLVVEVTRGAVVESRHLVSAALADAGGELVATWGEVEGPVFARSAVKPIQALPLLESGAAEALAVSDAELALACASHGGEPLHVAAVRDWLARLGLAQADLECGAHPPLHEPSAEALVRSAAAPSALHNNCSGKHAAMLATARYLGEETRGYIRSAHPVQRRVAACLAEMSGCDLERAPVASDGCGIPTFALPLSGLARAMARLAEPAREGPTRAAACRRVAAAMAAHPLMVAGHGRCCTAVIEASGGEVLAKGGAEGVYTAALPGAGLGLALKAEDGARRASEAALLALLARLAALDASQHEGIAALVGSPVLNRRGEEVGVVRVAGRRARGAD